jgi:hypothetical protein
MLSGACFLTGNHKIKSMADNKSNTGKADDSRVDANDPNEVEYLHRRFPEKTHQQIKDAIVKAGPMRSDILAELQKK